MIYLILSILLLSFNNILWKKNLRNVSVSFLVAYRALFTSLVSLGLVFYLYGIEYFNKTSFLKITIGSILGVIGLFSMLNAIKKTSLQWLGIYNLLGITFTSMYLYFFETIDFTKSIFGIILVIIGFVFYSYSNKETTIQISLRQHLLLLLMTICFCSSSLIHWRNLNTHFPPLLIISNQEIIVFITATILTIQKNKLNEIRLQYKNYFSRVLLMSSIIFLMLLCSFLGLKITNPLITSVLFLVSPLITIILSTLFFNERLLIKNCIAILIIATGAFILHYQNR